MRYTAITAEDFAQLDGLAEWRYHLGTVQATFRAGSFRAAAAVVSLIVSAADDADHHPDLDIRYPDRVQVTLTTHSTGGVTTADVDLAREISTIAAQAGAAAVPTEEARESFELVPVGIVGCERREPIDGSWDDITSVISLDGTRFGPEALAGLEDFSHLDVVFLFHRVDEADIHLGARHPRDHSDWPLVGIFAQRAKVRPNRLGVTTCTLLGVDGLDIRVRGLDAIDQTPVFDVKPHVAEFGPRTEVRQPYWMSKLMAGYW
jgi:tRNA-Thr(GGU) m(6)t(6)A37 methyltransferase TsaA